MDRYRDVLAGFEGLEGQEISVSYYQFNLEEARHHLAECRKCRATEISRVADDVYQVADCPLGTYGYYYAISESGTRETGKPVFAYHNCGGPARRLQELAHRLGRRKEA